MKKILLYSLTLVMSAGCAYALDTVFDSMDKATEVKLAPAIKPNSTALTVTPPASATSNSDSIPVVRAPETSNKGQSLKTQKFNDALVSLDDAQVELRQELSEVTAKYNVALEEKEKAVANCKSLKREMNAINQKMRNIDKSKKMINKSLESE